MGRSIVSRVWGHMKDERKRPGRPSALATVLSLVDSLPLSHCRYWSRSIPGKENSKCKGLEGKRKWNGENNREGGTIRGQKSNHE